jgi:cytoskeletal protein CcmA (bactofilin family)
MFWGKHSKSPKRIDCLIGADTTIEGTIVFTGGLRVDGLVKGNITIHEGKPATLTLAEESRVEGEINVPHVVINGAVIGPVYSAEHVELHEKAVVTGDVHYNTLEMQPGAVVQGRLIHQPEGKIDKVVQLKPGSGE